MGTEMITVALWIFTITGPNDNIVERAEFQNPALCAAALEHYNKRPYKMQGYTASCTQRTRTVYTWRPTSKSQP